MGTENTPDDTRKDAEELRSDLFDELYEGKEITLFNFFEPFDIGERPDWLLQKAKEDSIELSKDGGEFQTGTLLDAEHFIALNIAGHQVGKSIIGVIEAWIMATGVVPIALRYEKGVDTGVQRVVSPENIARFGLQEDGTCGNIIGAGIYPKEKIPPPGTAQIWIGTFKEVREKFWLPKMREWMPSNVLDEKRGVGGYSEKKSTFFCNNGNIISFFSFEQDYRRVQGITAWMMILDEEPDDRRFYTASVDHCNFLRMYYTPINGMSWSYRDIYLPVQRGEMKRAVIRHCTQYDSPYRTKERVETSRSLFKPYEIKAQIWGIFSEMEGKPYYKFEITRKLLTNYISRHTYATIRALVKTDSVRETLATKMMFQMAEEQDVDTWEIYEEYKKNGTYWLSADIAEGSEKPEEAQDKSAAYVRRLPMADEDETEPTMVAALHTSMRNIEFAWSCLYAAIYYNYCLMAPEARGEDGGVFIATVYGYPFLYRHVVISDATRRQKEIYGFDTTVRTRKIMFDMVGTWIYDHIDNPRIYHKALLEEVHGCIVGKKGRPDHPEHGATDCIVAFAISEYVRNTARTQIQNNSRYRYQVQDEKDFGDGLIDKYKLKVETRPILGSKRGMDSRTQGRINYAETQKQRLRSKLSGNSVRQTAEKIFGSF